MLYFMNRCLLLSRLDADSRALDGVCVGVRCTDRLDLVVVLCVLCRTAVGVGRLGGAVPVLESLAVGGAVDIVLICAGDCLPSELGLAV